MPNNDDAQPAGAHDADAERSRLDRSSSPASLLQLEQVNARIVQAVRKAMREEIHGFKGYVNAALSWNAAASLLQEGSESNFQREDPASNMFTRVSDILDKQSSPITQVSAPGRETPAEVAQDQENDKNAALRETDLAMKEMDESSHPDFSKGAVKISDIDDNEGLLVPTNGAPISAATARIGVVPTSVSQTAEDPLNKSLSVDEILNGGGAKTSNGAKSEANGYKE